MHSYGEGKRDIHIGVMVDSDLAEKVQQHKSRRRGMGASKSAVVNDILRYFFEQSDTVVDNVLHGGVTNGTSCIPTTAVYVDFSKDDAGGAS